LTPIEPLLLVLLLGWGTLAGLDLVTFPQALLNRPIVAGAGTGLLLGDPVAGLAVGAVLELFALDVLPVGASRYPDYGAAVVGAVLLAHHRPMGETLGLAVLFALLMAVAGGWSLQWVRQVNGTRVQAAAAGLAAGDAGVVSALQLKGVLSDGVRSFILVLAAVVFALVLRGQLPVGERYEMLSAVAVGAGSAAAAAGAIRSAGTPARVRWLAVGGGIGLLLTVVV
jgi:PTS system mannose-specific IIC component